MTAAPLKLLAILAHPDDESMGVGGTLAKYASEGVETHLVCATRGEAGWFGQPDEFPGPFALGQIRERELYAAADVLGIRSIRFLDECDGALDRAQPARVVSRIVRQIREVRPDVVVTFGPDGAYGHPDHIAISQLALAAVVSAADSAYRPDLGAAHRVSKLYYLADTDQFFEIYASCIGPMSMTVDGVQRLGVGWEDWMVTTRIDADAYWETAWRAFLCHVTQWGGYRPLEPLLAEHHATIMGVRTFYRAFSLVNGGRALETDLFEGLR
jgi:LmbE family N-acetylglucosaminyl deacetylase